MDISFDRLGQFEAPILTLCNPNSEAAVSGGNVTLSNTLGMLSGCKNVVLSPNFNSQWELSFEFSDSSIKQLHTMYMRLEKGRYIYMSGVGYFMIDDYSRHEFGGRTYKTISCHSVDKEIERGECPLLNEGSYYFYTKENDDGTVTEGIIQKQMALLPKWTLGFVSDDLKEKTAYFDGENKSDNAYEFLWEETEDAYECIIDVDFITRTLSFYSLEYYAAHHKTDIHLSKSNDLKEVTIESKDDDCFTAITVKQNDNLSLVYSNPNGSETLYNFTHCFSDMSSELQTALIKWQEKYEATILPYRTLSGQWANALDDLTNAEKDLDILKEELNNLKISRDTVINATASEETKQANLNTVNANISAKEQAIFAQENVIATKKENIKTTYEEPLQDYVNECSLSLTAKDTSGNFIFTQGLLNELSAYINPAEYSDDYITQTDDMKYAEIYQQSNKLFDRAKKELEKLSTQSYTFSVENNSFLFNKKFERFAKQLMPGAIVYLETSDDHMEQVHLTNFSVDYDDRSVKFTFGNKYDENDIKSLFDDVFGSVKTSAAQVKYLKNIINDQRSELEKQRDWIDTALTLTKDHALSSIHQTVVIDDSGYWGRKLLLDKDGNVQYDTHGNPLYENEQLKITNNGVYLTTDNWSSLATAIGKIYLYHDEETGTDVFRYGVAGDLIVGKLFLGKELALFGSPKQDGSYAITLNENGLTIINDGTTAGITIKDTNGNKQFYADQNGDLHLSGIINAGGGSIAGWSIGTDKISSEDGSVYLAPTGDYSVYINNRFTVKPDGHMTCTDAEIQNGCRIGDLYIRNGGIWSTPDGSDAGGIRFTGESSAEAWVLGSSNNTFYVTNSGHLHAESADITGTIEASQGHIANWEITSTGIVAQDSNGKWTGLRLPSGEGKAYSFFTGASAESGTGATFIAHSDGSLYATNAYITGELTVGSKLGSLTVKDWDNGGVVLRHEGSSGSTTYSGSLFLSNSACSLACTKSGEASVAVHSGAKGYLTGTWVYTSGSSGSLSDKSMKTDIVPFTDSYNQLFDNLQPRLYKYIEGTSGRKHFGFIAQDTEDAILKSGLTQKDVAFVIDMERDGEDGTKDTKKFLRYEEFIALNTWQIQKLKQRIKELEDKLSILL